jgi:diguanylate cyclase (GGDEF)-like protein
MLRDLGSTNGTFVNDRRVSEHTLRDGDQIRIGRAMLKFITSNNVEAQYHEEIYRLMTLDGLTSVHNRRFFNEAIEKELARSKRYKHPFALVMFDIDHFKKFNDNYGHEVGDQVLRMVASRMARVTGGGQAFRAGGEEFCVVFRESTVREALPHLELLREAIESSSFIVRGEDRVQRSADDRRSRKSERDVEVSVTVSIGTAQATPQLPSVGDVIQAADEALYHAKDAGRNRVEVYRPPRRRGAAMAIESL